MTTNSVTGDRISTKLGDSDAQRRFEEGFERIFGKREDARYESIEREHFGDFEKKTGVYAPRKESSK